MVDDTWSDYDEEEKPRALYAIYNNIWYHVIVDRLPIFYFYRKTTRNGKEVGTVYVCDSKRASISKDDNGVYFWQIEGLRSLNPISYSKPHVSHLSKQDIFTRL